MVCKRMDRNTSTWGKKPDYFNILRLHQVLEVFHDNVHAVLMEIWLLMVVYKSKSLQMLYEMSLSQASVRSCSFTQATMRIVRGRTIIS